MELKWDVGQFPHMFTFSVCATFWRFCSFFTQEEHHTMSHTHKMDEKCWFEPNRDLGEVQSRLGKLPVLWIPIVIPKELCMGLSKDYNRDLKVPRFAFTQVAICLLYRINSDFTQVAMCLKSFLFIQIFLGGHGMSFLLPKKRAESPESCTEKKSKHMAKLANIPLEFREHTLNC